MEPAWFAQQVDECLIFNNSIGEPELIGEKARAGLFCWDELLADLYAPLDQGGVTLTVDIADLD